MMSQPGLWSNSMHFQVLILTSSMSGKSKKSYWQAFSYARDSIHEAFFHLGSVPLESTVADALEYICKLSCLLSSRLWCLTVSLLLSNWYPGSGVVLDCIDFDLCRLSYFVLASHRYCSTHCVDVVNIWENKSWIAKTTTSKSCDSRRCQTCAVPVYHLENLICH